jgi:hypothetical protein
MSLTWHASSNFRAISQSSQALENGGRGPTICTGIVDVDVYPTSSQSVEDVLFRVEVTMRKPENNARNCRKNAHCPVIPHQKRVLRQCYSVSCVNPDSDTSAVVDSQTNDSLAAAETAVVNRYTDRTSDRIFLGAFVKAYSNPVIDVNISDKAMRI